MKKGNVKIEDVFTEAQSREVSRLIEEGYKLFSFICGEHVIEMNKQSDSTGTGVAYAYIKPDGAVEKWPIRA